MQGEREKTWQSLQQLVAFTSIELQYDLVGATPLPLCVTFGPFLPLVHLYMSVCPLSNTTQKCKPIVSTSVSGQHVHVCVYTQPTSWSTQVPTFLGGRIWKSNLGAGQGKLVGSFVMTHRSCRPQPDPQATLNRIANTGFSMLNWHLSYAFLSKLSTPNWCFQLSSFCMLQQQPARISYVLEHATTSLSICNVM